MSVRNTRLADGFAAGAFHGVLPFLIWAAHFFVSYASAVVACALDLQRFTLAGVALPSVWLGMISFAAIAALGGLIARAFRYDRAVAELGGTLATVRIGAALLALTGVLWSVAAIVFAPLCGT